MFTIDAHQNDRENDHFLHNNNNNNNNNNISKTEINGIHHEQYITSDSGLKHLPHWPPVNLEFQDLVFSVPQLSGRKEILHGISGEFRPNQLTAILGPSGSGKTTLLNILAGYKTIPSSGQINMNKRPRDMRIFRKMSRYIMQNEVLCPQLTIRESMMVAADLKLGYDLTKSQKTEMIDEILDTLRLTKSQNTRANLLSGGEKKRLSIALELVNNPPVIFLDEPTTGLDDMAGAQCVSLLKRIAHGGRTIICSVHTPSAKMFEMFDHVYIMADGQCVYQGSGSNIVPYVQKFDLNCPLTYNPADFIIEVLCGEYGNGFVDQMATEINNGKCSRWTPNSIAIEDTKNHHSNGYCTEQFEEEINPKLLKPSSSWWLQFSVLFKRFMLQMWRDTSYIKLKFYMTIILGVIVGGVYQGVGNDATKALFNFGFAFTIVIAYMYKPMMPVLLQFPTEVQLLKREHFNKWYRLSPYYCAMTFSKMPIQIFLAIIYLTMIYLMSNQPLDIERIAMVYSISFLLSITSDSLGTLIASRLSVVNAMFIGPVLTVPLMLLAVYGFGSGTATIPSYVRFIMSLSYLRHGLEGLLASLYGNNRADTICPETEMFCIFRKGKFLLEILGFGDVQYIVSICALFGYYVFFSMAAYYMIRRRLSYNGPSNVAFQYVEKFIKTNLNFAAY